MEEIKGFLEYHGFTHSEKIIGKTPHLYLKRGLEIESYLKGLDNKVDDYVILDDDTDMTSEQKEKGHFMHINSITGLTEDLATEIVEKFKVLYL